jgi:hypothetical protein
MESDKKPKWDLAVAIEVAKKAHSLTTTYSTNILPRLQTDELPQFKANTSELELRRSGQQETLTTQKSKTEGQDEIIKRLNKTVISVHNIVSGQASGEIQKAYGVGERISLTVSGVTAAANSVIKAYNDNKEWSNKAGIIEADITMLTDLIKLLGTAEDEQDDSMFARISKTMSKTVLHRAVEDEVTRLSAVGAHAFLESNPAVSALFLGLIPSAPKTSAKKTKDASDTTTDTATGNKTS